MSKTPWLVAAAVFSSVSTAGAYLCSPDRVPAATVLFPFVTGRYAAGSTATVPLADRSAPHTVFSVTNVTHQPKIVNVVVHNDFGYPLLSWNALLTGYDVASWDFADVMEGRIVPTGPATNAATGRAYSPTGDVPPPFGPVPAFITGIPSLPQPGGVGTTPNGTGSLFSLCTNPVYTSPAAIDPGIYRYGLPRYQTAHLFAGLRQSQAMAVSGWLASGTSPYVVPDWLSGRTLAEDVWAFVTVDVVDTCTSSSPSAGAPYFQTAARPVRSSSYANNGASGLSVALGNCLLGDFREVSDSAPIGPSGTAVSVEIDQQDVVNSVSYPRQVLSGASFYRYVQPGCGAVGQADELLDCTGSEARSSDYVRSAAYNFGPARTLPSLDFREPLPSAFAFRWYDDDASGVSTRLRVWKEFPDTYAYLGNTYVQGDLQYSYYAWDEEEHVLLGSPYESNQFPLAAQEVDVSNLQLPTVYMKSGWMVLAFPGSAGPVLSVPGGYSSPAPNAAGVQAWVDVHYRDGGSHSVTPAHVVGNFLCDGFAVAGTPATTHRLDLGNVLY